MQTRSIATVVGGVVVLISMFAACEKSPTRPAPTNGPTLRRVEISGPDTIAPGTRASYTLTGFLSDGTTRDVTRDAAWRSSNIAVVGIDGVGMATAGASGETQISGIVAPHSSVKNVEVRPPGTFRLMGSVFEEGSNLKIASARVEVRAVTGAFVTTTGFDGSFKLFAVPADVELIVTHPLYVTHAQNLHLSENTTLPLPLKLAAPPADLSGTYSLTVGAAQCASASPELLLAEEIRQRTYTAVVTHVGSKVDVTLSGAEFPTVTGKQTNHFTGRVTGTRATFVLYGIEDFYYVYYSGFVGPDVAERLADGTFLVSSGGGDLTVSPTRWEGTLQGNMRQLATVPNGRVIGMCSGSIALTFTK